ncbi:ribonuclease CAF1 [Choiromyces venosus 120613-1]|uniref:Ribonuclease CAF1 n=1 Tax=Choiromyces venosus 120613-1 TaxID=1336337 RepID=A0A3N4K8F0_9PEZI|nr:ribonuclease CAF1 [Choiromyces venosus 120613-1]
MDVNNANFRYLLPDIIDSIESSSFVAIDLELSGIHKTFGPRNTPLNRKQNLEERYQEVKAAAERFQVLQFGLCAVSYDEILESYICRPFNFFVNPNSDTKFGLDREYVVQASAIGFLLESGFDFNATYSSGIRYMSCSEEQYVVERENRAAQEPKEDIHIDDASQQFVKDFIAEIQEWVDDPNPAFDFVNISTMGQGVNSYQKRLIHQVVRKTFPHLQTMGRPTFVQVIRTDPAAEKMKRDERRARFDLDLQRAIGLRHVIDALFASKKPLVGHNIFTDLINLYECFIGTLPDTSKEFAHILHRDFPIVIDTKFIATCDVETAGYSSNLQGIWDLLSTQEYPAIELDIGYTRYATSRLAHEAGYDSYNTAQILVRLVGRYHAYLTRHLETKSDDPETMAIKKLLDFLHRLDRFPLADHRIDMPKRVPSLDLPFWKDFINKLRVNGTLEGLWLLEGY